jgi:hypothetical protein
MTSIAELTFQLIPADPKEELHGWSYHIYIPRLRDERDLVNAQVGRCLTIGDDAYLSTVVWEGWVAVRIFSPSNGSRA